MLLILNNTVSQATFGYLLFTEQHLWKLGDTCHAVGHQVLPTTFYRECYGYQRVFFTLRRFLPDTPCCWLQGFPGASSSTWKLAGLHADHRNIVPAQLLCRMRVIHKRGILIGSIYVPKASFEVRIPQPWNLPFTGFEPTFLKVPCIGSCLSWRSDRRVLWVVIDG